MRAYFRRKSRKYSDACACAHVDTSEIQDGVHIL